MAETLRLLERQTGGVAANLPHLSDPGVMRIARKLSMFPEMSPATAMSLAYPHTIISKVDDLQDDDDNTDDLVTGALRRFEFGDPDDLSTGYTLADVQLGDGVAEVTVESAAGNVLTVTMPCGPVRTDWRAVYEELLPEQRDTVTAMLMDHATDTDLCLLGGPGSGKTTIVRAFAAVLGYVVSTVHFFQDMTSRDILQRRGTDISGNTKWDNTTVIRAAVLGELAILDGTHRIPSDVLAIMQRLCLDRDLELFDGTRLMRWDRYDTTKAKAGLSDDDMAARQMFRIHESFRIVAVGEPPGAKSAWLTSELVSFFSFHVAPQIGGARLEDVMCSLYPSVDQAAMHTLITFTEALRDESEYLFLPRQLGPALCAAAPNPIRPQSRSRRARLPTRAASRCATCGGLAAA
eukprot:COSAG04_NODE_17_length_40288_cov_9.152728_9_plen_406_part_00